MMNKLKDKAASAAQSVKKGSSSLAVNIKNGAVNLKDKVQNKGEEGSSPRGASPSRGSLSSEGKHGNTHSPSSASPLSPRRVTGGKEEAPVVSVALKEDPMEAHHRSIFRVILDFETDDSEGEEKTLDLSSKDLAVFPKELKDKDRVLKSIKRIDLSSNYIPTFPRELYKWLDNVEWVDISRNRIQRIPDGIHQFNCLHTLIIHHNRLDEIPEKIGEIRNLRKLDISYNLLTELPASMWLASGIKDLKISGNRFAKGFPLIVTKLEKLESLEAKECFFTEIPKEIAWLDKLESFDLTNNQIETLPEEIGHLSNLLELNLSENPIKRYPVSLGRLELLREEASNFQVGNAESCQDERQKEALIQGKMPLLNLLRGLSTQNNYQLPAAPPRTANPPRPVAPSVNPTATATAAVVDPGASDPEVEKKVVALSDWIVKNADTTKSSLIAIKSQMEKHSVTLEQMRQYSVKVDAVFTELESKKTILPKYRELELPRDDPNWNEIDRLFKHSEAKIYNANTCLTMTARHVPTLKHSSKLEEVVSLVKVIRALQAILA
eukprot:TRINITY_DN3624_c0_g1_i1.p1 TRINITY_DN3624_c0_g1~~TRINITY_DN3624_c0_g1_i1.p1  ORF type:complete len:551 (-),score=195.07 TRINITY_DN3624_c0_g1_i1:218-1870(-)